MNGIPYTPWTEFAPTNARWRNSSTFTKAAKRVSEMCNIVLSTLQQQASFYCWDKTQLDTRALLEYYTDVLYLYFLSSSLMRTEADVLKTMQGTTVSFCSLLLPRGSSYSELPLLSPILTWCILLSRSNIAFAHTDTCRYRITAIVARVSVKRI